MENKFKIPFEKNSTGGFKAFFETKSGKFKLSVIAGQFYYSSPRENVNDPDQYYDVELAVFKVNENEAATWASYNQLEESRAFEVLGTMGEYEGIEVKDKPQFRVFGWIPVAKIEELYNSI